MQVDLTTNTVQNNTGRPATQFKFSLNAKTAQLLADPYANKHESVIREVCCNAHDAHIAAGKADVPFHVKLPTRFDPVLEIMDFGTGIAPDRIGHIYATYGVSDKDHSNDFTGGLGFGSKAPFAVSKQFTVESRIAGRLYAYSMFKDDEGIPAFVQVGEMATELGDGLTVKIPVDPNQCIQFQQAAAKILRRFNPLPQVTGVEGFTLSPISYRVKAHTWRVAAEGSPLAVQGNVAYPISRSALGVEYDSAAYHLLDLPIEIDFAMGEIQVPLSREAISYTPRTIANIKARLDEVAKELPSLFEHVFDDCKTLYEAKRKYAETFSYHSYQLQQLVGAKLMWNGQLMDSSYLSFDWDDIPPPEDQDYRKWEQKSHFVYISSYELKKKHLRTPAPSDSISFDVKGNDMPIIIWDNGSEPFVRKLIEYNYHKKGRPVLLIKTPDQAVFDETIKHLGSPPWIPIETLEQPPKVPRTTTRSVTAKLYVCGKHDGDRWRTPVNVDPATIKLYVPLHLGEPKSHVLRNDKGEHVRSKRYEDMTRLATNAGLLPDDAMIYGVPASHKNLPNRYDNMELIYDFIKDQLRDWIMKNDPAQLLVDHAHMRAFESKHSWKLISDIHPFRESAAEQRFGAKKPFRKLLTAAEHFLSLPHLDILPEITSLCQMFGIKLKDKKPRFNLEALLEEFEKAFPMHIAVANSGYVSPEHMREFIRSMWLKERHG